MPIPLIWKIPIFGTQKMVCCRIQNHGFSGNMMGYDGYQIYIQISGKFWDATRVTMARRVQIDWWLQRWATAQTLPLDATRKGRSCAPSTPPCSSRNGDILKLGYRQIIHVNRMFRCKHYPQIHPNPWEYTGTKTGELGKSSRVYTFKKWHENGRSHQPVVETMINCVQVWSVPVNRFPNVQPFIINQPFNLSISWISDLVLTIKINLKHQP